MIIIFIILDQGIKIWVVDKIPLNTVLWSWNDWIRISHVRNTGVAFSFGSNLPLIIRKIFFSFFPAIILIYLVFCLWKKASFNKIQDWVLILIIAGGSGNVLDRIFRSLGVVDYIDLGFIAWIYFGQWPIFNLADILVSCGLILFIFDMIRYYFIKDKIITHRE